MLLEPKPLKPPPSPDPARLTERTPMNDYSDGAARVGSALSGLSVLTPAQEKEIKASLEEQRIKADNHMREVQQRQNRQIALDMAIRACGAADLPKLLDTAKNFAAFLNEGVALEGVSNDAA